MDFSLLHRSKAPVFLVHHNVWESDRSFETVLLNSKREQDLDFHPRVHFSNLIRNNIRFSFNSNQFEEK